MDGGVTRAFSCLVYAVELLLTLLSNPKKAQLIQQITNDSVEMVVTPPVSSGSFLLMFSAIVNDFSRLSFLF